MNENPAEISAALEKTGYVYSKELNQFAPVPEGEGTVPVSEAESSQ